MGLIPKMPLDKVEFIGNAASVGAERILLSKKERQLAEQLARQTRFVDIASSLEFQTLFADNMLF